MNVATIDALVSAKVYDLEQLRFKGMPNHPNNTPEFSYYLHRRHENSWHESRTPAAGMITTADHTGTHIDALCHQSEEMMLHGGVRVNKDIQTSQGFTHGAAETIEPIIRRGVLLDVAAHLGVERIPEGYSISSEELKLVAKRQATPIQPDDVVLVHTGYGALWNDVGNYDRNGGVCAEASQWLAGIGVHAVGADNAAWDVPSEMHPEIGSLPGHVILLVRAGIFILEHLRLEELARDGIHEFCFIALPLKIKGATGSPIRPIAMVMP